MDPERRFPGHPSPARPHGPMPGSHKGGLSEMQAQAGWSPAYSPAALRREPTLLCVARRPVWTGPESPQRPSPLSAHPPRPHRCTGYFCFRLGSLHLCFRSLGRPCPACFLVNSCLVLRSCLLQEAFPDLFPPSSPQQGARLPVIPRDCRRLLSGPSPALGGGSSSKAGGAGDGGGPRPPARGPGALQPAA